MGINMNASLLLNEDVLDISNLCYVPVSESYYLSTLDMLHEMNTEIRNAHLELYQIASLVESTQLDPIQEANLLKEFGAKLNQIFDSIIKAIKKIKDFLLDKIDTLIRKSKNKMTKEQLKVLKDLAGSFDQSLWFTANIYSNTLKNTLTNVNIPDVDLIYNNKNFDHLLDKINYAMRFEFIEEELQELMQRLKDEMVRDRNELRARLVGLPIGNFDMNDVIAFRKQLSNYYIGEQSQRQVDSAYVERGIENLNHYYDIIGDISSTKKKIEQRYGNLITRVQTLRKQANQKINDIGTKTDDESQYYMAVSSTAIVLSNMVNGYLQDHMMAYTMKLECLVTMQRQDTEIINHVKNLVNNSLKNESYVVEHDLYDDMDNALKSYCEGCYMLREHFERNYITNYVTEAILLQEADKDPNFVNRIIDMITSMFRKFLTNLNQLIDIDKKWLEQNEKTIKANDWTFPGNEKIGEWIPYRREMLYKAFDVPAYNPDDTTLQDNLKDEESFAKFLFNKIGANESMLQGKNKEGNFAAKCKAIYAGGDPKDITPAELTKDKDAMYDYCKDYNQGENGGIYKSIVSDTNKLDQSKKAVMRALNNYKPAETQQQNNNSEPEKPNSEPNKSSENQSNAEQGTKQESYTDDSLDLTVLFGLTEAANILQELTTPNVEKADKEDMKSKISSAGGDTAAGLKELKEKATRYFTMTGNALGAKMTASMQCYKQYKQIFRWALKAKTDRPESNSDNSSKPQQGTENNADAGTSIVDAAKNNK